MSEDYDAHFVSTDEEREAVYRFRYDVFVEEQSKYVRVADHDKRRLIDDLDAVALHLCVVHQGKIVASMRQVRGGEALTSAMRARFAVERFRTVPLEAMSFSGRLLVLREHRGSPALIHLLRLVYRAARMDGMVVDFINCNPHLVRLYEQLGYRRYTENYEDPNLGFQVPLALMIDDDSFLERIGSPFAAFRDGMAPGQSRSTWFDETFPEYRAAVSSVTLGVEAFVAYVSERINAAEMRVFRSLDSEELGMLIGKSTHLRVSRGSTIVRRGDLGEEMFVLLDGVAEVRRSGASGIGRLATLVRGDVFGEMALANARVRSADVVAATDVEVMCLERTFLHKLVRSTPSLAAKLLLNVCGVLAERLEATSSQVMPASTATA